MKGEVRHERTPRKAYRRDYVEHSYHLVLTVGERDFDMLRAIGYGSINRGLREVLREYREGKTA